MKTILMLALVVFSTAQVHAERGDLAGQFAQAKPPAAPGADRLIGSTAWSALLGNTVVGKHDGQDFADYYLADGTVKSMQGKQILAGTWSLEGDKICFVYKQKECYAMEVMGDTVTFTDALGTGIRGQILKGNARNL